MDIPDSTTSRTSYVYHPNLQAAPNTEKAYHGRSQIAANKLRFREKSESDRKDCPRNLKREARKVLSRAKAIEQEASELTSKIIADPTLMVIPLKTTNKKN